MSRDTARKNKGPPDSWEHLARPREMETLTLGVWDAEGSRWKNFFHTKGISREAWLLEA